MDWFPIALGSFKAVALGTAMFYAIKWHYDQGEKGGALTLLRTGGKVAAAFLVTVLVIVVFAFVVSNMLGLDLSYPS
jgi:hypothetical protein